MIEKRVLVPKLYYTSSVKVLSNPAVPSMIKLVGLKELLEIYQNKNYDCWYTYEYKFIYDGVEIPDVIIHTTKNNRKIVYSICDDFCRPFYRSIALKDKGFSGKLNPQFSLAVNKRTLNMGVLIDKF